MRRAVDVERRGIDLVADAFLAAPIAPGEALAADGPLFAAAPGRVDTGAVLGVLRPGPAAAARDLGGLVGSRLARLERAILVGAGEADGAALAWCPRAGEGLALKSALVLGRLGALIRPARVSVLWFAGDSVRIGRSPTAAQVERARRLAEAALPGATVSLHRLGWTGDPRRQLEDLAGRFA